MPTDPFGRGNFFESPSLCFHKVQTVASPFQVSFHSVVHAAQPKLACALLSSALPAKSSKPIRKDFTTATILPLTPPILLIIAAVPASISRVNSSSVCLSEIPNLAAASFKTNLLLQLSLTDLFRRVDLLSLPLQVSSGVQSTASPSGVSSLTSFTVPDLTSASALLPSALPVRGFKSIRGDL